MLIRLRHILCLLCCGLCLYGSHSWAQVLKVGVKNAPPFAMQLANGEWGGLSVELWQEISAELGYNTEWVKVGSVNEQIAGLIRAEFDVAVGALTVTAEREQKIDFSHAFYSTGLGIAARSMDAGVLMSLKRIFSPRLWSAVGVLAGILLTVGVLMWLLERRANPQHFAHGAARGIGDGFWWSAVTMTTVGYGDKVPVTLWGRSLATIWMFVSVVTISGFTAAIASAVAVNQLSTAVSSASDLTRAAVGTVEGSTGARYLESRHINATEYGQLPKALQALSVGHIDAVVYDLPLLKYELIQHPDPNIELLSLALVRQDYAFALRSQLAQREVINQALLHHIEQPSWRQKLFDYLGDKNY